MMTEIRIGKFSTESPEELLSHIKLDSVKIHTWYNFFELKPMGKISKPLYLKQDSIPSFFSVKTGQWIHGSVSDTISLLVGLPKPMAKDSTVHMDTLSVVKEVKEVTDIARKTQIGVREAKSVILLSNKKIRNR